MITKSRRGGQPATTIMYKPQVLYLNSRSEAGVSLLCINNEPTREDKIMIVSRDQIPDYSETFRLVQNLLVRSHVKENFETAENQNSCDDVREYGGFELLANGVKTLPKLATDESQESLIYFCIMTAPTEHFFAALAYCRDLYKDRPPKGN